MLYHLFTYLDAVYDLPGAGLFRYITFRAAMSLLTSLIIGISFGKTIIGWLQIKQVGEIVRDLGLQGQIEKRGTPTMGGVIILTAILVPTLLFADLTNVYTHMMIWVMAGRMVSRALKKSTAKTCRQLTGKTFLCSSSLF